jgi:hypothetical protein
MATERDQEEQDLRIDQMTVNIDKMRADLAAQQRQLAWETRKFGLALFVAGVGFIGALVTIYHLSDKPVVQQFPPGTVITIPPAKL